MLFDDLSRLLAAFFSRKVTVFGLNSPFFFRIFEPRPLPALARSRLQECTASRPDTWAPAPSRRLHSRMTHLTADSIGGYGDAPSSRLAKRAFRTITLLALTLALPAVARSEQQYPLRTNVPKDQTRRIKAVLEVEGELKLNADGRQVTRLPMKVRADLLYSERILSINGDERRRRDIRHYEQARAEIQVGEKTQQHELRSEQRLIVADSDAEQLRLYSPTGPLTREELELVDIQGNSGLLYQLIPDRDVAIDETWSHEDPLIAKLFGLDAVHQNGVQSTLRKVDGKLAVIDLKGAVSGAVAGISTDLGIKAVYNFDLDKRQVTWLAVSLTEDRAVGHAEPGFEVTVRLRLASFPAGDGRELSDDALAGLDLQPHAGSTLLDYTTNVGGFRFLHDRAWRVMIDRHDVAILRRVERGDLIAQCNVSSLPDLKAGQHPQLETFQADVKRALGKSFGQFVEASQLTADSGLHVLRTVIVGTVSELPIQWTYYHFSDETGRQVALVFTLDAQLVDRFAQNDVAIADSFQFQDRIEPTPVADPPPDSERQAAKQGEAGAR